MMPGVRRMPAPREDAWLTGVKDKGRMPVALLRLASGP
jgi:hypothetical protein